MLIVPRPLTAEAYASYGHVIMASPRGEPGHVANQGTARRFDHLAPFLDLRAGHARANLAVFRCAPFPRGPIAVALLEKHPASTQVFVPMNARRYLVIVALGAEAPDLGTLAAFIAEGAQGISYAPGVWHHPMIALETEVDFACLVWEDGTAGDCVMVTYPESERPVVVMG